MMLQLLSLIIITFASFTAVMASDSTSTTILRKRFNNSYKELLISPELKPSLRMHRSIKTKTQNKNINFKSFKGSYHGNLNFSESSFPFFSGSKTNKKYAVIKKVNFGYYNPELNAQGRKLKGFTRKDNVIFGDSSIEQHALYLAKFKRNAFQGEGLQVAYDLNNNCQSYIKFDREYLLCDYSELATMASEPEILNLNALNTGVATEEFDAAEDLSTKNQNIVFNQMSPEKFEKFAAKLEGLWAYDLINPRENIAVRSGLNISEITQSNDFYPTFKYFLFDIETDDALTGELLGFILDDTLVFFDPAAPGINASVAVKIKNNKKNFKLAKGSASLTQTINDCYPIRGSYTQVDCVALQDYTQKRSEVKPVKIHRIKKNKDAEDESEDENSEESSEETEE